MNGSKIGQAATRGEYLVLLRHGIRQSTNLGQQLTGHPIVGHEVRALMGRLQAIEAELDELARVAPYLPPAHNDPVWGQLPHSFGGS